MILLIGETELFFSEKKKTKEMCNMFTTYRGVDEIM